MAGLREAGLLVPLVTGCIFCSSKSFCLGSRKIRFDKPSLVSEFKRTSLNYEQNFMLSLFCQNYAFYKLLIQNASLLEVDNLVIYVI